MADALLQAVDGAPPRRAQIAALQTAMEALPAEQLIPIESLTDHYFASGVYVRSMRLPKGVTVVGKIHKTEHVCLLLQGRVAIATEAGVEEFSAPAIMVCPPGVKRAAFALEDAVWANAHAVGEERDLEVIEAQFIAADYDDPALLEALASHIHQIEGTH